MWNSSGSTKYPLDRAVDEKHIQSLAHQSSEADGTSAQ
jgi:hypothetical protein